MKVLKHSLFICCCILASSSIAQRGIDGNRTVNAANTIVNEYTTLTANAVAGATTINVAASGLNANTRFGAGNSLATGDLIMIIQMQGATILGAPDPFTPAISNPNDATWGGVTNYNNTGKFEFCQVSAVPSTTSITVDCGLQNNYTAAGKVQVIRVPRYNTLLIQSPGILTCQNWNGSTGGVLTVEVYGNTTITAGGKINTTGTGFRGGALFTTTGRTTTVLYSCVSLDVGTNKGEGIAGYDTDYTPFGGKYCRGAAANAGGGGNVWNCGGGGGANGGVVASWTGQGNPNNSVGGWTTAWNLESAGFAASTSSGGGRGGYSFSSSNQNATTLGPGTPGVSNAWSGSFRYNLGGLGGRPLDYSTGRIFLGGGGGAGEQDNNQAGAGGAGGGIIYITSYGSITGSGNDSIISNGSNGGSTLNTGTNAGKDAGGGAGGGGAILINSVKPVTGVFIKANGGIGGSQLANTSGFFPLSEAEGPGGGGGGGYIGITSGPAAASQQALGGTNGISQSPHVTEFTPNGATMGGAGLTNQAIVRVDTISVANATICSGNTATLTATINGTIPVTVNWYAAATGGASIGTGTTFTTPVLAATTTYYVGFCPGTYRIPVVVTVNTSPTASNAGTNQTLCSTSATLAGNTPTAGTGTWTLISGTGTITTPSSPTSGVTGLGAGANVFEWTITNPPCGTSSTQVTITNSGGPTTSAAGSNQTVCGTTATLAGNTPVTGTGIWTLVSGSGTITTPSSPTSGVTGLGTGANVFQWTISNACGSSNSSVTITGVTAPTTSNAGTAQTVCGTTATLAGNTATSGTGTWTLVSGTGTITTPSSPTSGVTGLGTGANVFQWTISNSPCTASTSTVTITGVAAPTTSNAGTPQSVCGTTATLAGNTATSGTGIWTLVSGTGTITTPSSPTSGVTGLGVGANVFQWTISNSPCTASSSTVTITGVAAPTTSNAGTPQTVCGTTATLAGNTATSGTGTWTLVSGTGTITSPSSPTSGVTGLGVGANVFQWTISNSPCTASSSTVTITGVAAPTISNAGTPQSVCGTTATLAGNTATSGTGIWTLVSGAGTITTPSSPTSGVTGLGTGANVFQWTISNAPCTASTSTVTITGVAAPTTSNAGTAQTVCGTTATLAGNTATSGTGTWTLVSGAGTITTPSSPTSGVTGLGVGANVFQWTISNSPCTASSSTVTITGVAAPTTSNAGTNQTLCSTSATLAGNTPTTGTGIWTLVSGAGTITTPSSPTSTVTGLGAGANVFQWTITNAPCTASSSTVTITNTGGPTTSNAGTNQSVCGTTATLAGNTPTTGTGTWTLVSGTGTITTPSSPTSGVTGLGAGANIFQWTISNPPCTASSSTVTITGVTAPTTSNAGTPQSVCGTTATLAGNNPTTGTGTWTLVSGAGTITTPSSPTSGVTGLGVGANIFQWTIDNPPCAASTSTVTITGVAAPTTSNAGTDQTICGTTATLAGNTATSGTGTWTLVSGAGTITTPSSPTSGVTALGVGANVFQWTISNSPCTASSSVVTITVTPLIDATINSVAPICLGSAPFNLSAATAGGTWTGTGITSGATGTFDPATAGIGTYLVTYTISGSCGNTDTAFVTVTPNADATITPQPALCVSAAPITLSAATTGGTWSGTGITNTSTGAFDPSIAGIGIDTIIYSIPGTCGAADTIIISVNATSDATITQPSAICLSAAAFNLSAATAGGTWTGTGITSGASGTFDPAIAGIGTHIITYAISGTCGATDTVSINVTSSLSAAITAVVPVCANSPAFNLTGATAGGTWSGTGITDAVNGTFNPSAATIGANTITYSISGACGDTATQTVTVNALPTPTFTADVTSGCAPVCVTFTETATNNCNSMVYNFGDGSTSSSSTSIHCYTSAGSYDCQITCTDTNNCIGTITVTNMINVFPTPVASFTMSPSGVLASNTDVVFTDISSGGSTSFWNFGDPASAGNTSGLPTTSHIYTSEGTYCITLISSNASCADTTNECITVANDATISIPNVFTPNGDGHNDVFYFTTSSVKELTCSIYDRWGLKIAEWTSSNDAASGWDGRTTSGLIATDGVYYFIIHASTLNDKVIEEKGFVQLLKEKVN